MIHPLKLFDSYGNAVALGANVEIPSLPAWLVHDLPTEELARLEAVEGSVMRVNTIRSHSRCIGFGSFFAIYREKKPLKPCETMNPGSQESRSWKMQHGRQAPATTAFACSSYFAPPNGPMKLACFRRYRTIAARSQLLINPITITFCT